MTSRELVYKTLEFKNPPHVPRQLWALPWAAIHHPWRLRRIKRRYPDDISSVGCRCEPSPVAKGNDCLPGESVDAWGCRFTNIQLGYIGEVKRPIVTSDDWSDVGNVRIPEEWLTFDIDDVNKRVRRSDKFMLSGHCPRPFEQLQFIRGTENLYMDLTDIPPKLAEFMERMHDFYCRVLTRWAQTDVDALSFMDDWGSQNSLLINPKLWKNIFLPMYRDYSDIAKKNNKKIFMHSDGYTLDIFPSLIDIGVDAVNSQIFCIGTNKLKQFKGKITFWGEIDRQHMLPYGTPKDITNAVRQVFDNLWDGGGCIAQCEFSTGSNPRNVEQVYKAWGKVLG